MTELNESEKKELYAALDLEFEISTEGRGGFWQAQKNIETREGGSNVG